MNSLAGLLKLPKLPYDKLDSVEAAEAAEKAAYAKAHKLKPSKPNKPAVPARECPMAARCDLRARGKCDSLHCGEAYEYEARRAAGGGRGDLPAQGARDETTGEETRE